MLVIPGGNALSAFRAAKVLRELQWVHRDCYAVNARFIHFATLHGELNQKARAILEQLLRYGQPDHAARPHHAHSLVRVVTPRVGTISPWSTKATDILHHCGLGAVARVERGVEWRIDFAEGLVSPPTRLPGTEPPATDPLLAIIHDPMTESVLPDRDAARALFYRAEPATLATIDLLGGGLRALEDADAAFGFALSSAERAYLLAQFTGLGRNPTDVELMMFAQVNSEHCRHKIFNASWRVDGQDAPHSLFDMIRETHRQHGDGTLVAYHDNAAVLSGAATGRFQSDPRTRLFGYQFEPVHLIAKVETHNHPTGISPFAGAATGAGGEIRDEGATGRGGKPKAGVVGYSVSHLRLPGWPRPWEGSVNKSARIASPLQIMLDGPLGAAAFNNEFGRPNIAGYFRTFEQVPLGGDGAFRHGYHKPIMLAGGMGNIRPPHIHKNARPIPDGAPIVVLGGPVMLIGLGGGAASSVASGSSTESLDYASVQRGNPEMQRRCQEVIDACCALGEQNPIWSIHDVGAGGLCNALPELINDSNRGGEFQLRAVLNDEPGMTPLQVWCNESQERYVLAIDPARFAEFERVCQRERCLYARVGHASAARHLRVADDYFAGRDVVDDNVVDGSDVANSGDFANNGDFANSEGPMGMPIDLPMELLFGLPPKMQRDVSSVAPTLAPLAFGDLGLHRATELVLGFPTVADKTFLITIGDRSVGGLVVRDQMVGPWQVPVADVGVTASGYRGQTGEAVAIGERTPLAAVDAAASARMAVGEAITNIAAAAIGDLGRVKLSANWMVAAGEPGQDADLFRAVRAVALELCPQLGISIPVGKDSMSMKSMWRDSAGRDCQVVSPVSLVVTAFAPVTDIRATLTPQLAPPDSGSRDLWLLDLGAGRNRLGGSVLAQATAQLGDEVPDVDDADRLKRFFHLIQALSDQRLLLAYHDRSDGGLLATLCEMAFASRCGLAIELGGLVGAAAAHGRNPPHPQDPLAVLFNEELGAVIQSQTAQRNLVTDLFAKFDLHAIAHSIGRATTGDDIVIQANGADWLRMSRPGLHRIWSETTWRMQSLRDHPDCADEEYGRIDDLDDPGLFARLTFDHPAETGDPDAPSRAKDSPQRSPQKSTSPARKIAILREQGVNGQLEMAAAFDRAGFAAVDVTMSDLAAGQSLDAYHGLAACGGFSFGDVLGAGEGWAKSILFNPQLRAVFAAFFQRDDTFALGVCNGCQMMAAIAELIPGATHWPKFTRNRSEQYEARVAMVEICSERSILLRDMKGSMLPVSTAHGEGRADFARSRDNDDAKIQLEQNQQISLRFVDNHGNPTETYPANPNGSPGGATGFANEDGRFTIMMPHPERVFRAACNSWRPGDWGEYSPWIKIFRNAREWVS